MIAATELPGWKQLPYLSVAGAAIGIASILMVLAANLIDDIQAQSVPVRAYAMA